MTGPCVCPEGPPEVAPEVVGVSSGTCQTSVGSARLVAGQLHEPTEAGRPAAYVAKTALRRVPGDTDAVIEDREPKIVARLHGPRSGRGRPARAGPRWTPPPAAPVAAARAPVSGTAVSIGSAREHARREAQHRHVLADQAADLGSQRVPPAACCSSKMVPRIALMVRSSSSTARSRRAPIAGSPTREATPCSCSPVAKSRWITTSCRSRAIRSRSEMTASSSRSTTAWARSSASPAWSAKEASSSCSSTPGAWARVEQGHQDARPGQVGAQRDHDGPQVGTETLRGQLHGMEAGGVVVLRDPGQHCTHHLRVHGFARHREHGPLVSRILLAEQGCRPHAARRSGPSSVIA